jgi:hypothetical protein
MAATGFTPIQLYRTTTASAVPVNTNLADGELAINTTDEKLYFKNAAGTVKLLAANITPVANGGTGVTTSTGTGNTVLSAAPTFTGTAVFSALTASSTITGNGSWVIGNADTDTVTQAASYVNGTKLRSAKVATNTLAMSAYDVDGTTYIDLVTLTASNTPTLALTSIGVGTINNMSVGAITPSTGAFTTLTASTAIGVASGGTGATSLTANNVILGNGTSAVQVVAPGANGNVLTSNGTTWTSAAPSGGTTYSVKTANYTAVSGNNLLADTSAGSFTITLPATPATGSTVYIQDSSGTFAINPLTVGRNGSTIMGLAEDMVASTNNVGFGLTYNGSDWRIY